MKIFQKTISILFGFYAIFIGYKLIWRPTLSDTMFYITNGFGILICIILLLWEFFYKDTFRKKKQ